MLTDNWEIAGGTIIGKEHVRNQKNNQDAWQIVRGEKALVAVVSDGCSAGSHSEVGAKLGSRLLAESLSRCLELSAVDVFSGTVLEAVLEKVRQDVLATIRILANVLGGSFSETIENFFLFTVLGVVITEQETFLFAVGDGIFFLNGEYIELAPYADNHPSYLSYALVNTTLGGPENFRFKVVRQLPTKELENVVIGTDGVRDLILATGKKLSGQTDVVKDPTSLWLDDHFFRNPDQLRRYLTQVNRELKIFDPLTRVPKVEPGYLPDDTTIVILRRKEV